MKNKLIVDGFWNCLLVKMFGAWWFKQGQITCSQQNKRDVYVECNRFSSHSNCGHHHEDMELYLQMQKQCKILWMFVCLFVCFGSSVISVFELLQT